MTPKMSMLSKALILPVGAAATGKVTYRTCGTFASSQCSINRFLIRGYRSEVERSAIAVPELGYSSTVAPTSQLIKKTFVIFHNPSLIRSRINPPMIFRLASTARSYSSITKSSLTDSFRQTFYFPPTILALTGILTFALTSLALIMPLQQFITLSDAESLRAFTPQNQQQTEIEDFINSHSLTLSLRDDPTLTESRPTLKVDPSYRPSSLTSGTLFGPGKIVVPPFVWSDEGKSLISIQYLGEDLCGHPGYIHGGLLATLLDEGLARCSFPALPSKIGMTANLTINYRKPSPAGSYVVLRAKTVRVDGRKAWVEGHIETLPKEGEKAVVLAEASALMVEPRSAQVLASVVPLQ